MKVIKTTIPIYKLPLEIVYGGTYKKFCKKYGFEYNSDYNGGVPACFSEYYNDKDEYTLLLWFEDNKPTLNELIHECVHLKNAVWDFTGLHSDQKNDEHEAYFMGYVAEKIQKKLKNE